MTAKLIGNNARPFYAGLSKKRKQRYQDNWTDGRIKVLCATTGEKQFHFYRIYIIIKAFGMGIDKQDVRFIIHRSLPRSLTEYCQETGRAGRDGLAANCFLLYKFEDQFRIMREIEGDFNSKLNKLNDYLAMNSDSDFKKAKMDQLREIVDFCERSIGHNSAISPYQYLKNALFDEKFSIDEPNLLDVLSVAGEIGQTKLSELHIHCARKVLFVIELLRVICCLKK